MDSLTNLDKDVATCLRFLITNQKDWKPVIDIHTGGGQTRKTAVTLIGDER